MEIAPKDPVNDFPFEAYINHFCETYGWHIQETLKNNTLYQLEVLFTQSTYKRSRENRTLSYIFRASPNLEGDDYQEFYNSL